MKYLVSFFILMFSSLQAGAFSTDISQKEKPPTIKILLHKDLSEVLVETEGRYLIYNPLDGAQISWGIFHKKEPLTVEQYGLYWGEKFPGSYRLRIVPKNSESHILINNIEYPGCIEIHAINGKLNVINEIDIETFLKASLALQFTSPLEEEVMNAIAIVARTNLYYTAQKNSDSFWHFEIKEIPYKGALPTTSSSFVDHSVDTTRHAVLTFNNATFPATWTTNSAGQTLDFASIFRKAISTPKGVTSAIAAKTKDASKWSFTASRQSLAKALHLKNISAANLYMANHSEKVYAINLRDGHASKDIDFFHLQNLVGKNNLKSNNFTVALQGENLLFTGFGEGPGTGLCLYSSQQMAKKGDLAPQILSTFFPETKLEKIK